MTDERNTKHIRNALGKVLTPEMERKIRIYHFRGGIDYPRLCFVHRIMMSLMLKMLRKKPKVQLSSEEKTMIETYGQVVDFSDKSTIVDLIHDIKSSGMLALS